MRPCWYAFQGVACILSPYGAFTEIPPALPGDVYYSSGKPATLVSTDKMPAKADAEHTANQLTSPITADVPTVAIAVCAIVFIARIDATFVQVFQFLFMKMYLLFTQSTKKQA